MNGFVRLLGVVVHLAPVERAGNEGFGSPRPLLLNVGLRHVADAKDELGIREVGAARGRIPEHLKRIDAFDHNGTVGIVLVIHAGFDVADAADEAIDKRGGFFILGVALIAEILGRGGDHLVDLGVAQLAGDVAQLLTVLDLGACNSIDEHGASVDDDRWPALTHQELLVLFRPLIASDKGEVLLRIGTPALPVREGAAPIVFGLREQFGVGAVIESVQHARILHAGATLYKASSVSVACLLLKHSS